MEQPKYLSAFFSKLVECRLVLPPSSLRPSMHLMLLLLVYDCNSHFPGGFGKCMCHIDIDSDLFSFLSPPIPDCIKWKIVVVMVWWRWWTDSKGAWWEYKDHRGLSSKFGLLSRGNRIIDRVMMQNGVKVILNEISCRIFHLNVDHGWIFSMSHDMLISWQQSL